MFKNTLGTYLVVQWLRLCLAMQEVQVPSLVREVRSYIPAAKNKTNKQRKTEVIL